MKLNYPLLERKWKWLAFTMFPLPFIILGISFIASYSIPQEAVSEIIYLCWALGFGILISLKEEVEDEMIHSMRLKAFQMGVYFLMSGTLAIMIISNIKSFTPFTEWFSAYAAIWLLHTYIYATYSYLKWKNSI
ncbi:hypothetical protein C9994_11825 [Marivirga lumbricoides]|uniref:Uncharacterized protein n=1 Tax=Marivirga lumbricoides TaxID=1046115 RepID=A0A2T4DLR2_9BACT|nr:hypothetical protein C9994_11825 [Marivirga lumbricoides]